MAAARGTLAQRREMVDVCRRLYDQGLIAGPDGNVSVRLPNGRLLVTPAGMSKVDVKPGDIVELAVGRRGSGVTDRGSRGQSPGARWKPTRGRLVTEDRRPTTELGMHLRLYERRADISAVVHAHPPTATGFAVAGEDFMAPVLPEIILQAGGVPLVPYATPGTDAVAEAFEPFVSLHDVFLMANHGATTVGPSLRIAHQRMESLEHVARIILTARQLGRVNHLSDADAARLLDSRARATYRPSTRGRRGES